MGDEFVAIVELNPSLIEGTFSLCKTLKQTDEHPCSFWGEDIDSLNESLQDQGRVTLVAVDGEDHVFGIGNLVKGGPFQDHWAEISIAIHPSFRKNGLARRLVANLEKYGKEFEIDFIKALILENNQASRSFFEALGYEHRATLYQDFNIEGFGPLNDCCYYKIFNT